MFRCICENGFTNAGPTRTPILPPYVAPTYPALQPDLDVVIVNDTAFPATVTFNKPSGQQIYQLPAQTNPLNPPTVADTFWGSQGTLWITITGKTCIPNIQDLGAGTYNISWLCPPETP